MMDSYWANYDKCLDRIKEDGRTVDDVIRILKEHYEPSSGEAFFPGGADRSLWGTLMWDRDDWSIVWSEADYFFAAQDSEGNGFTFCEGDVYRGTKR
ncbi:hypothetical protein ACFV6Y_39280 [Streptomyces massasporeus]|uniref:hypothetical protein n=1 Tax=Streptomyces massasporeus TaxID=67324 RepID=UPI0036573735